MGDFQNQIGGVVRDLVGEVHASQAGSRRRQIEMVGRVVYIVIIIAMWLVSLHLYTRPESTILKLFGFVAATCLMAVSVLWSFATHYSAAGLQRGFATFFWAADLTIGGLNVVSDFSHELKYVMPDWMVSWYTIGSIMSIIFAAGGLAIYLRLSPEQSSIDAASKAVDLVGKAIAKAIENPDDETKKIINKGAAEITLEYTRTAVGQMREGLGQKNTGKPIGDSRPPMPMQPSMRPVGFEVPEERPARLEMPERPMPPSMPEPMKHGNIREQVKGGGQRPLSGK